MVPSVEETEEETGEITRKTIINELTNDPFVVPTTSGKRGTGKLLESYGGSDLVDRLRNSREEVESSDDFRSLKHLAKLLCEVTSQQQYQLEELTQEVDALSEVDDTTLDSLIQNSKRREKSLDDLLASAYDLERALLQSEPIVTATYLRRAFIDAKLILIMAFVRLRPAHFSARNLATFNNSKGDEPSVNWVAFKNSFFNFMMGMRWLYLERRDDGDDEYYTIILRKVNLREGEDEPQPQLDRIEEYEFSKLRLHEVDTSAEPYPKEIKDEYLPPLLQFFVPELIHEAINEKRIVDGLLYDLNFLREYKTSREARASPSQARSDNPTKRAATIDNNLSGSKKQRTAAGATVSSEHPQELSLLLLQKREADLRISYGKYIVFTQCAGLLLDTKVITLFMNENLIHKLLSGITHANERSRIEGLEELSVKNFARMLSEDKMQQFYVGSTRDRGVMLQVDGIDHAVKRIIKVLKAGYRKGEDAIPFKDDIEKFIHEQRDKGHNSVITEANCRQLENLLQTKEVEEPGEAPKGKGKGKVIA